MMLVHCVGVSLEDVAHEYRTTFSSSSKNQNSWKHRRYAVEIDNHRV